MSTTRPVTETVIIHLQQGVDLEQVYAGHDGASGTPAYELTKLGNTLKAQEGFIRQFWGQQHENPNIFVWSIDWQSFDHHAAFINSESYKNFMAGVAQVFDLAAGAPLMMHTAFTTDATAARQAPVTEFAFFFLSKEATEEQKTKLEDACMPVIEAAKNLGGSSACAVGWIFEDQSHPQATNGEAVAFQALLGWSNVESHMEFRQTPALVEIITPVRAMALPAVQGKTMFHVALHAVV